MGEWRWWKWRCRLTEAVLCLQSRRNWRWRWRCWTEVVKVGFEAPGLQREPCAGRRRAGDREAGLVEKREASSLSRTRPQSPSNGSSTTLSSAWSSAPWPVAAPITRPSRATLLRASRTSQRRDDGCGVSALETPQPAMPSYNCSPEAGGSCICTLCILCMAFPTSVQPRRPPSGRLVL
jgi:hypothetical protein